MSKAISLIHPRGSDFYSSSALGNSPNSPGYFETKANNKSVGLWGYAKNSLSNDPKFFLTSSENLAAAAEIASGLLGSSAGKAVVIARLHMSAVRGAPIESRASVTNEAVSQLQLRKYCENPPLFTSDSSAQIAENTLWGVD